MPNLNGYPAQRAAQHGLGLQRRLYRAGRHRPAEPDRAQVLAEPEPAQPDGVRLGEHRRARNVGRLRRHASAPTVASCWRAARSEQRPLQCGTARQPLDPPAQPRPKHQRHHGREPDRGCGQVRHRSRRPHAADGHRSQLRILHQQGLHAAPATATAFHLPAGSVGCTPAGYTVGASTPGNVPPVPGNYASSQAWGAGFYFNDTIQVIPELKLVGGLRWDILLGADRQLDQPGQHAGQHTRWPFSTRPTPSRACAAA